MSRGRDRDVWAPTMAAAIAALVVLNPLLRRGFALTYDMVFLPEPSWTPSLAGRGPEVPRAVPSDAVAAILSHTFGGEVAQRLVLLAVLVCAGAGAARLVRGPVAARCVTAVVAVWNPFVAERLAIGQWALLVGYAALPWAVAAAVAPRRRGWLAVLVLCLAAAALGGGSAALIATLPAAIAAALAPVAVLDRCWRVATVAAVAAVVNAPWWVPAVLRPADLPVDPESVAVFAVRAEGPGGLLPTLLTGGGIWNADVVPEERSQGSLLLVAVLLVLVAVAGLVAQHRGAARLIVVPLVVAGVGGLLLAALSSLAPDLARSLVTGVPGGGLLRDAHKLVAPWTVAVSVGLGGAVAALLGYRGRAGGLFRPAAVVVAAAGLLVLPSLATGLDGRLTPVRYPDDYAAVAGWLERRAGPQDVAVVMPWQPYRAYDWVDGRTVLDPLPRWLPTTTVTDDDLTVGTTTVSGEGPLAARLDGVMSGAGPLAPRLAASEVRWVVVERRTGIPPVAGSDLEGLVRVRQGRDIDVWRVPGVPRDAGADLVAGVRPPLPAVLLADLVAGLAVAASVGAILVAGRSRRPRPERRTSAGPTATLR